MKIAFVGKGGSGKTTLTALTARHLALQNKTVLAIDADINQHLATTLGMNEEDAKDIPALGLEIDKIKHYLKGDNQLIAHSHQIIKTTPPGKGSRLLKLNERNEIWSYFMKNINGINILATGPFDENDIGVKCYHSKTGAVELILNHLVDKEDEYVLVDMTAGADSFSSGLFTRFDITFIVVEPTLKSISVYKQYKQSSEGYGVKIAAIGNKINSESDLKFLKDSVGDDLITTISSSEFVKSLEKGERKDFNTLEKENIVSLDTILTLINRQKKNWVKFYKDAVLFHKKNAESWANSSLGIDLMKQIDPEFSYIDYL